MKTPKVYKLSRWSVQEYSPIGTGVLCYLLLKDLKAAEWVWGAFGLMFFILIIAWLITIFNSKSLVIRKADGGKYEIVEKE